MLNACVRPARAIYIIGAIQIIVWPLKKTISWHKLGNKMKRYARVLIFAVFMIASASCPGQQTYYVSPSGNNNNDGSWQDPWQTLTHAFAQLGPSDDLKIFAGTYLEKVELFESGTSTDPITIEPVENHIVILDGTGNTSLDAMIGLFGSQYVTIRGLVIQNNVMNNAQGIIVEGDCDGVQILNCVFNNIHFSDDPEQIPTASDNAQPIIIYGTSNNPLTGLVIRDNIVHDCRTGFSEGLAINGNVDDFIVAGNTVHDITNIGIDLIGHEGTSNGVDQARNGMIFENTVFNCKSPYATAAGIYVDGGRDLIIERNLVHHNQWGIEIGCENLGKTTSNVIVRNNVIYANDDAGIVLGGYEFPAVSGKVIDCEIVHNSCYGNDILAGGIGGATGEFHVSYTENCSIKNNIFFTTNTSKIAVLVEPVSSSNLMLNHNLYWSDFSAASLKFDYAGNEHLGFNAYQSATGQGAMSLNSDPLLTSTTTLDIGTTSPCVDQGAPTGFAGPRDYAGMVRLINGGYDIGAYEMACRPVFTITSDNLPLHSHYAAADSIIISVDITIATDSLVLMSDLVRLNAGTIIEPGQRLRIAPSSCN